MTLEGRFVNDQGGALKKKDDICLKRTDEWGDLQELEAGALLLMVCTDVKATE